MHSKPLPTSMRLGDRAAMRLYIPAAALSGDERDSSFRCWVDLTHVDVL